MVPPHFKQRHRSFSLSTKAIRPMSLIHLRLSIILIEYFVLYLLSSCLNRLQGYSSHSKQNPDLFVLITSQFLMMHLIHEADLLVSSPRQPGHLLFSLRYAIQIPQFIPHGAMSSSVTTFDLELVTYLLYFIIGAA